MRKQLSWLIRSAGVVVLVAVGAACSRKSTPTEAATLITEGSGSMSEATATMNEEPSVKGVVDGKEVVAGDQPNEHEE